MGEQQPVSVETYLRTHVAPRFGQIVSEAAQRLDALQREVADLRAARGSLAWEVEGDGGGAWYLNIAAGAMAVEPTPLAPPFMTVTQSAADWQRFIGGAVSIGLLSGGGARRNLGQMRIDRLKTIKGSLRFVITGFPDGGEWSFVTRFGPGPFPAEPQTTVTIAASAMQQMQSGELNPQLAFMQGQVKIAGDAGLAMQLGMAMFL